ncbi:hypothetical protein [Pseudomonas sp. D3-10]|uniref:hypothetical protein n=1 Tax=unclassified Pseudomonas TaxID=196821 RepID=UPI003DA7DC0B
MSKTAEQRLDELEIVVRTLILFNQNAVTTLSKRVTEGNPGIARVLAQDLATLKSRGYENIDNELHDSFVDSLIAGIN